LDNFPERLTERDREAGAGRVQLVRSIRALMASGYTQRDAAVQLKQSVATINRLARTFAHLADHELTPENLATKTAQCGRKTNYETIADIAAVQQRLQQLYLATCASSSDYQSKDRRTGSASLALERFADDPLCPAPLAAKLRKGAQPKRLVSIIRRITPAVEQRLRGPGHQSLNAALIHRRTMTEKLPEGTVQDIQPGDWWVFDDMSTNNPFWFSGPDDQPLIGRQGLYGYDIMKRWLGVELIGTARDSYTAAIILRFLRRLMQAIGKPRRGIIFERSVWQANAIAGNGITAIGRVFEDEWDRAAMTKEDKAELADGIKSLGLIVHYTYTPRGKEIEGAFNYLQSVFPTFAPEAVNIGRHAGEFERGAKAMRRARGSTYHPEDLGFLHIDRHADLTEESMQWINKRNGCALPSVKYPLSKSDLVVFLPSRHDLQIRNGQVTVTIDGQPYDFVHPEKFATLGNGYRVTVKCDPAEPTLGAAIYNRELSSANFAGYQLGELICLAEFKPAIHRFDWSENKTGDVAAGQKRRYNKAVRTAFRAVGLPRHKAATIRDGRGNVAETSADRPAAANEEPKMRMPDRSRMAAAPINRNLLARQAEMARATMEEE
jgi:hypothetical protein